MTFMKIISGSLRGLLIPKIKNANYRPSTGKFKEALFSILTSGKWLENGLHNKNILDLFAGTGSLGLEALSRGAQYVTFVDIETKHLDCIKSFVQKQNIIDKISLLTMDATNLHYAKIQYDVVFLDPPYKQQMVDKSLISLHQSSWLNKDALVIIECALHENIIIPEYYTHLEERTYTNSKMILLQYIAS
jgi:16S rRNA (guanine966-N2)-methyltransferase